MRIDTLLVRATAFPPIRILSRARFAALALAMAAMLAPAAWSGADSLELARLQGSWSGKRTTDSGAEFIQTLEITGDKLAYTLVNADKEVRLFATGIIKTEKLGPFNTIKLSGLQAGRSASDTQPVEDDRTTIYVLNDDTLTLASNFDKERDNQKPALDIYRRVEKLAGKWKMSVKLGDNDRAYDLTFTRGEGTGKWAAVLTSATSGDHKFKSVSFLDGKLSMELIREIQGTEATITYVGEFKDDALAGTFEVKGFEEQYKGTWAARR